jgi:hypothetical protein
MIDDALDTQPAADTTDAPGTTSPTPSPATGGQQVAVADAHDDALDLLSDTTYEDDDGDAGEVGEVSESEQLDLSAYEYTPPDGQEFSEFGKASVGLLNEHCARNGIDPEGRNGLLELYDQIRENQKAAFEVADKAAAKAAEKALGGKAAYEPLVKSARAVLRAWPEPLRAAIEDARTSDGRRLALMPEFVRALADMGQRRTTATPQDKRTTMHDLQAELADINAAMHADVANLYKPWRATGKLATDRKLEILRQLNDEGPSGPTKADLAAEEREILKLKDRDFDTYRFGDWNGTGRPASDRLLAIRTGHG